MKHTIWLLVALATGIMNNVIAKDSTKKNIKKNNHEKIENVSTKKTYNKEDLTTSTEQKTKDDKEDITTSSDAIKNPEVLVVNHFEIPMIFGIYDFDQQQVVKIAAQIDPGHAINLNRNFFANNLREIMKNQQQKFVVGCAYGNEVRGPKNSYFIPNWRGVVLETQDLLFLSSLFKDINVLLCSMFLLGEYPIVFFNSPEKKSFISIPCGNLRTILGQSYNAIKNLFESIEFYRLLWENPFYNQKALQKEEQSIKAIG